MQEIKRILERRFKGESQRSIASSLHLSRNTVSKVFKAVSYTHLDVYKRQILTPCAILINPPTATISSSFITG